MKRFLRTGEPFIWLTGGALCVALLIVAGLIGLILVNGLGFFWPSAVTRLTKTFLSGMLERRRGWILNVASTAAFQPGPIMAVYYATKAYVLSFSEALANETAGTGVRVTVLCPGPTRTEFQRRAGFKPIPLLKTPLVSNAADVAREGWEGMKHGRRIVVPGLANRLLVQAERVTPRRLVTAVIRRLQESRS